MKRPREIIVNDGINYRARLAARELESRRTGAGLSERINRVLNVNRKEDDAIYWPLLRNVEDGPTMPEGCAVRGDNRVCAPRIYIRRRKLL